MKYDYVFMEGGWEKKYRCGVYAQQRDIKGIPLIQHSHSVRVIPLRVSAKPVN